MELQKYCDIFAKVLGITDETELPTLKYQKTPGWDSVAQMMLCVGLEETFDVHLEGDDIMNLQSHDAGIEILKKYGVTF